MSTQTFISEFKALAGAIAVLSNGQQNQRAARGGIDLTSVEAHSFNVNLVKGVLNPVAEVSYTDLNKGHRWFEKRGSLSSFRPPTTTHR